jgi:hypothetical protein
MILGLISRKIFVVAVVALLIATAGAIAAAPSRGNIEVQIRNCGKAVSGLQKAAADAGAQVVDYNQYTNSENGKRSINANYRLKKEQILPFMNAVAALGEIQNQSYSENRQDYDTTDLRKRLESYQNQLDKVLAASRPDHDLVQLLNQQIENLERQLREAKASLSGDQDQTAQISISLKEKGYDRYDSGRPGGLKPIVLLLIIIVLVFAAGLVWSLLALNAMRKRAPQTPRDV